MVLLAIVLFPFSAIQAAGLVPCGGESEPMCDLCYLVVGFDNIIENIFLKLLAWVSLAGIAISGVMYMVSTGNETMIRQAKDFLKASVMGFTIVLTAWLMVNVAMLFLSAKSDLGVTATSWSTFDCDHTAPQSQQAPAQQAPAQQAPVQQAPPQSPPDEQWNAELQGLLVPKGKLLIVKIVLPCGPACKA